MPRPPQTAIRSGAPEEVLALVAHTLGFWPEESLVLVSLRGPRRRTGLVLRVDLADLPLDGARSPGSAASSGGADLLGDAVSLEDAALQLVAPLVADGAGAALAVVLSRCGGPRPEHAGLAAALGAAAAELGVELLEVALVDGDRLHSLTCALACCPPEGRPLGDVRASVVGAEMVASGSVVARDRTAVVAALLLGVAPAEQGVREEVARLVRGRGAPAILSAPPAGPAAVLRSWWDLVDQVVAPGAGCPPDDAARTALDPPRAAALLAALGDPGDLLVRDAVLVGVVSSARELLRPAVGGSGGVRRGAGRGAGHGAAQDEELRCRLVLAVAATAEATDAGDPDVLAACEALVRRLAQLAPHELRAQPLAVLAHWAWWRGSTLDATVLAEEARRVDPCHSLASLVLQMAACAVPPDWVRGGGAAGGGRRPGRARSGRRTATRGRHP